MTNDLQVMDHTEKTSLNAKVKHYYKHVKMSDE
jgi:hypothetical protein